MQRNRWVFSIGGRRITVYRKDDNYDHALKTALGIYHSRAQSQARKGTSYAAHPYYFDPKVEVIERSSITEAAK